MKKSKHSNERSTFLKKGGLDQIFVNTVMKNSDQAMKRKEKDIHIINAHTFECNVCYKT